MTTQTTMTNFEGRSLGLKEQSAKMKYVLRCVRISNRNILVLGYLGVKLCVRVVIDYTRTCEFQT